MSGFLGKCDDCGNVRSLNNISLCRSCDDNAEAFLKGVMRRRDYKEGVVAMTRIEDTRRFMAGAHNEN